MAEILIIDDDPNLGLALQMTLAQEGHTCRVADRVETGWSQCQQRVPDLALLDLQLPDGDGLELLSRMRESRMQIPVVVMTAFGTVTSAVTAMKRGAADFIEKPMSVREVCGLVLRLLRSRELARQLDGPNRDEQRPAEGVTIVGRSPGMVAAMALADKIARLPPGAGIGLVSTLITGETGTGKELIARYIHQRSPRPDRRFVQLNCTAIPENLFESELFGHERGVFTDAKSARQGLFETAREGTLFLDEIGDMPVNMQAKLLVAIETGRFRRLGSTQEQQVDLRVIAATNSDLPARVRTGRFRADLYHRLRMLEIRLPPLRERGDDLFLLCDYFLTRFSQRLGKPTPRLSPQARDLLARYPWPGNVRELGHTLLRCLVNCDENVLEPQHFHLGEDTAGQPTATPVDKARSGADEIPGDLNIAAVEERLIQAAMARAQGNITEAARLLGMTRGTLRYRLEKMGWSPNAGNPSPSSEQC